MYLMGFALSQFLLAGKRMATATLTCFIRQNPTISYFKTVPKQPGLARVREGYDVHLVICKILQITARANNSVAMHAGPRMAGWILRPRMSGLYL